MSLSFQKPPCPLYFSLVTKAEGMGLLERPPLPDQVSSALCGGTSRRLPVHPEKILFWTELSAVSEQLSAKRFLCHLLSAECRLPTASPRLAGLKRVPYRVSNACVFLSIVRMTLKPFVRFQASRPGLFYDLCFRRRRGVLLYLAPQNKNSIPRLHRQKSPS